MGRPRKRRREGDDLELIDLDGLGEYPTTAGFNLSSTDLSYDFTVGQSPFLNPPDILFGTQLDPGLLSLDPILDQPSNHAAQHHENGSFSPNSHDTRDPVLLQSSIHLHNHGNRSGNHSPFQATSLPNFPAPSSSSRHNSLPLDFSGKCSCLRETFLTLSNLQLLQTFSFPESLHPIRKALQTTKSLLQCSQCPRESTTAMQNTMHLATLLTSITDAYRGLFTSIDSEAARVQQTGEKKHFRIGDSDPGRAHLHTGTMDCPMGFNIALAGSEWRMIARKVVEGDILPPSSPTNLDPGSHPPPQQGITILGLANQLEERQLRWHESCVHEHLAATNGERCIPKEGEEFHCLRMVKMVRGHVALLKLGESGDN